MKNLIMIIGAVALFTLNGFGQTAGNKVAMDKINAARIALITQRLNLSPKQAEQFWPVYNEFAQQRKLARDQLQTARRGLDLQNLTEDQSKKLMEVRYQVKQKELDLDREYSQKLAKIVNSRQLLGLKNAEDDFRRMLVKQLERRRAQQRQRDQILQQRERNKQRNNN